MNASIPKLLHFCWFSGDPYPELVARCLNSWRRELPGFELKLWTRDMAEALNFRFVNEALSAGKWAFAADVVRLYALYTEGGIYLDADVFVKQNFESFLDSDFVTFVEHHKRMTRRGQVDRHGNRNPKVDFVANLELQAAFLASVPGHPFLKRLLDCYSNKAFTLDTGGGIRATAIAPEIYAREAEAFGFKYRDETQLLESGIKVWSSKFLAGCCVEDSEQAFAVHLCAHSWHAPGKRERLVRGAKEFVKALLGSVGLYEYVPLRDFLLHYVRKLDK